MTKTTMKLVMHPKQANPRWAEFAHKTASKLLSVIADSVASGKSVSDLVVLISQPGAPYHATHKRDLQAQFPSHDIERFARSAGYTASVASRASFRAALAASHESAEGNREMIAALDAIEPGYLAVVSMTRSGQLVIPMVLVSPAATASAT